MDLLFILKCTLFFSGTFNAIQKSYDTSTDALKKAEAAQEPLKKLTDARDKAVKDLNRVQPANTKDLLKLKEDLATRPDLTPAAEKVRLKILI